MIKPGDEIMIPLELEEIDGCENKESAIFRYRFPDGSCTYLTLPFSELEKLTNEGVPTMRVVGSLKGQLPSDNTGFVATSSFPVNTSLKGCYTSPNLFSQVPLHKNNSENNPAEALLNEREKTHGDFIHTAAAAQRIKEELTVGHSSYSDIQREALDHIATKLARIANGNPDHLDVWADISGYCQLVIRSLKEGYQK